MKKLFFILSVIIIFNSCKKGEKSIFNTSDVKPAAGGRAGEIIAVIDDSLWNSSVGDSIFYFLSEPFYGLPQDEPTFKVPHVPPQGFKNLFKSNRNVLIINIKPDLKNNIQVDRDLWARGQLVIQIQAPDTTTFIKLWNKNKTKIRQLFFNEEIKRYQAAFASMLNKKLHDKILAYYGIDLTLPNEYKFVEQKGDFLWFSRETSISTQAIFIYSEPFTSSYQLNKDSLIVLWDKLLYKYVPGPKEGTYPSIELRYPVKVENINLNGKNAIFMRGLWKTEGGFFLGGPFLSLSIINEKTNRMITLFSVIYGGKKEKKLYVWQVEAILKSVKLK